MRALLDANVLFSAPLRDIHLQLAVARLIEVRWTDRIQEEWIEALLRKDPMRSRQRLARTRAMMEAALPRARIDPSVIDRMVAAKGLPGLPDPGDRHVLAAAIAGECPVIVTSNLRHFPGSVLNPLGIHAASPDTFLMDRVEEDPEACAREIDKVRQRLLSPPFDRNRYLDRLGEVGLAGLARLLRRSPIWNPE